MAHQYHVFLVVKSNVKTEIAHANESANSFGESRNHVYMKHEDYESIFLITFKLFEAWHFL